MIFQICRAIVSGCRKDSGQIGTTVLLMVTLKLLLNRDASQVAARYGELFMVQTNAGCICDVRVKTDRILDHDVN